MTEKRTVKYRRGKAFPKLRHGDLVDMTTFPLGSKPDGRKIAACPKCGRKGELSTYQGGRSSYTHVKEFQTMFWFVRESCDVAA